MTKTENIALQSRMIRNPDIGLREEDEDGGLIFSPDTREVKVLNSTALLIWKLCDGKRTLSDIIAEVREEFDGISEDQLSEDVKEFVTTLIDIGFIGTVEIDEKA